MRVLHVCECLPGGPASYLQEVLPFQTRELGAGSVAVLAPSSQLATLGDALRNVETLSYDQSRRDLRSLTRLFGAIRQTVRRFDPDVVHLHSTVSGLVGRLALARHRSSRRHPAIVYCAHGWMIDPDRPQRGRGALIQAERTLSRLTDAIINISPHEPAFLTHYGFNPARMRLVVSGIGDKAVLPTAAAAASGDARLEMLFIGRLDYQKGFDLLLTAMAQVPPERARLTVVGEAVRGSSTATQDPSAIRYTGWLPRDEVARQIAVADVIVMPSRWEGMPLVALEAMRAGKALIASNKGTFPAIIENGVTGVLVDNENPAFLADTLERYVPKDFRRFGPAARAAYEQRFQASRMNDQLLSLYGELAPR